MKQRAIDNIDSALEILDEYKWMRYGDCCPAIQISHEDYDSITNALREAYNILCEEEK